MNPEDFGMQVDDLDERAKLHAKQREDRGWDDSETWSLDITFARWIWPRLERFKEITICRPADVTEEKWDAILGEMIEGFKIMDEDDMVPDHDKKKMKKVNRAINLFHANFFALWW